MSKKPSSRTNNSKPVDANESDPNGLPTPIPIPDGALPDSPAVPPAAENTCSSSELTDEQATHLASCEARIEAYLSASLDAGDALRTVRDEGLFQPYKDIYEYGRERWGFSVKRVNQLVAAVDLIDMLKARGVVDLPQNEAQARPLTVDSLSDRQKIARWGKALVKHGSPAKLSKVKVQAVIDEFRDKASKSGQSKDYTISVHRKSEKNTGATPGDRITTLLENVPEVDRPTVRASLLLSNPDGDATPEDVAEAAEMAALTRKEGGRADRTVVLGEAVEIVDANRAMLRSMLPSRKQSIKTARIDIPREMVGILDDSDADPRSARATRLPLLVVIPKTICPATLLETHQKAYPKKAHPDKQVTNDTLEVVVTVSELERHGGPVKDGVVDLRAVRRAARAARIKLKFNETGKLVGWARYTTNPLTGCSHGCQSEFCYASEVALRYFRQCFVPTIHPARLDAFRNTKLPEPGSTKRWAPAWDRSVFLGSMGDLFNVSFPDWWIQAVLDEIAAHRDWNVFILTKLPPRLGNFEFPPNVAIGVTVVGPKAVGPAARGLKKVRGGAFQWISVEPYLDAIDAQPLLDAGATFFAVGGRSRTLWSKEAQPDPEAVRDLILKVYAAGGWVYFKDNLDSTGHVPFDANVARYAVADEVTAPAEPVEEAPAVPTVRDEVPVKKGPKGKRAADRPARTARRRTPDNGEQAIPENGGIAPEA